MIYKVAFNFDQMLNTIVTSFIYFFDILFILKTLIKIIKKTTEERFIVTISIYNYTLISFSYWIKRIWLLDYLFKCGKNQIKFDPNY